MCFDRNINGNRDVKFFECDYWSLHWRKNITLAIWMVHNMVSTFLHLPHLFVHTWLLIYFMAPFLHILDYFTTVAYPICRLWRKIAFHLLDPFCTPFLTCKVQGPKKVIIYFSFFLVKSPENILFFYLQFNRLCGSWNH